nr:MAG TPA: hypothetical protein [Bacteriophage sp.]
MIKALAHYGVKMLRSNFEQNLLSLSTMRIIAGLL